MHDPKMGWHDKNDARVYKRKTAFCPQENEIDSDCYCLYECKTVMELSEVVILPDQTDEPMDRGTIIKY